ncbi:Iron-regulated outer membrane proteins [Delftia tsuruhatensis]|uniref:TonB-dependent siderophore receptor n=1 Tax=Delftia tsuruhatensis TaxID=180282 RepID=UPI001E7C6A3C|nr:Iron-regulated outer membrane proteins [Delftia tsuruhatensis]CAC9684307.1 Iron-regulated outer membrane proteins [Delftia tsuruhatensis]
MHTSPLRATALAALSLTTAMLLQSPLAQAAGTAGTSSPKTYQVQAGPLGPALMAFAAQAGVSLGMDLDRLKGLSAPGMSGAFSIDEGFAYLLGNTGLAVRRVSPGNYLLETQPVAAPGPEAVRDALELAPVTVTARTQNNLVAPSRQVSILEAEEVQQLRQGSDSLATLLSKVVPGMADSSHTITDYGQTLRGRNMLILVDGVPLNTNRDSSRNLANINPVDVEQIEVLRGSSAIYGSGAAGGVVSIRTKRPSGEAKAQTIVTGSAPLSKLRGAGLGGEVQHYLSGGGEVVDYSVSLGGRHVGGSYDANGNRIAPEPSQGDLFDSSVYNASAKVGFKLDATQRLQLSASHYNANQDTDYASDPSVARLPAGTASARPIRGLVLSDQNQIRNTMLGLDYENRDFAGSTLAAQLYYRDFYTRFAPFDARAVPVRGANVDQSMQNSDVFGGRLTLKTPLGKDRNSLLIWGADFNHERTDMPIDIFDPKAYDASGGLVFHKIGRLMYMPPVTTRSLGAFAQLQHKFNDRWSAEGGVRHDRAQASFDDFTPLSQSRAPSPQSVAGGTVKYGAWTYNLGTVFTPVKGQEFYASYSQGFELPDIGVVVRNANLGFNIGNSNLQAVKTHTAEIGWRGKFSNVVANLGAFQSRSDLGGVQSFNNGLTLLRTKEKIHGLEGGLDYFSEDDRWSAGGSFTWMKGRELPQGAGSYQDMTGYRIPPLKLTAYVEYRPDSHWSHRVQATSYASRDYRLDGKTSFGRHDTKGYTTVDLISQWKIDPKNRVSLGVENLLNRSYFPLYSQLLRSNNNMSRLPAAGTVLRISYAHTW